MSKVLKVAAVVVAVAAITVATAGIGAAPALSVGSTSLAIGGGTFATAGFTVAATSASLFGLSAATLTTIAGGLSLAASLTAKKPTLTSSGTQTQFKADPDAPIPYAIGRTFVAGNIVHQASSGANNEFLHFVLVWSGGGPHDSFEAFKVDGATVNFSGTNATGFYAGFMWLRTQLGACPEAAALTPAAGSMPGWSSSSKLSGYAAGLWTLKYDKKGKVYTAGVPKAGMVGKWAKVYDPRKDSTYPGGSGAHRPLVESTYEWSDNPWLNALTWAMGRVQNGQFVLGARQKFDSIDVAAFVEAANVADANGWKCGGLVTSADDPWQALKAMCQAGGGEPIRIGATLSCIVSTPRVSLGTISSADLAAAATVTATQPRRERINGVIAKYRSEDHDWEIVAADPVRIASYVTFDGRRRTREITYPLVQCFAGQQPVQVAQLAAYDIYNAREIPAIVTPLKIRFVGVKPGDCWTLDLPEIGLNNQLCMLRSRAFDVARGVPTLTWRSETTAKHAAALGKTTTPPPTPTLGLVNLANVAAPGVGAWSASGTALTANGASIPAIAISGAVDNPAAEAVIFEYRISGSTPWLNASTEDANCTDFVLTRVTPGTDYEVSVSYRVRNVVGARRVLGTVTAGAAGLAWSDVGGTGRPEDNADVTMVVTGPAEAVVYCDHLGVPTEGQLPKLVNNLKLMRGGIDVTADAVWGAVIVEGAAGSITNPDGGAVQLNTSMTTKEVLVRATASYGGVAREHLVRFRKNIPPPPVTSGGGGAGGGGVAYDSTIGNTTSSSYGTAKAGPLTVTTSSAGTSVDLAAPLSFNRSAAGSSTAAGKWQWRVVGGTWADVGSEITSEANAFYSEPPEPENEEGFLTVNQVKSGLSPNTAYEFQLLLRGSSSATLHYSGTASATAA